MKHIASSRILLPSVTLSFSMDHVPVGHHVGCPPAWSPTSAYAEFIDLALYSNKAKEEIKRGANKRHL